jgi:hypothetical protein
MGAVPMAAVVGPVERADLASEIYRRLDLVWAFLRESDLTPGHNVVLYLGPPPPVGGWEVEIGVQVDRPFADADPVRCRATPAGRVATATWTGPYDQVPHDDLFAWCRDQGLEHSGVTWEVYGDWHEDPAQLQTELVHLLADPLAVPVPTRAEVEAITGPVTDDDWADCLAIVEREGGLGIEVTAAYLAHAVGQARER